MKAYWGSGVIAPRILDLGTRWRWVVSFTPRPLYHQGKNPWYLLDRRLGGPQSRSGRGGEEKISQPLPGLEPPIIQPLAQRYTTELSRLTTNYYNSCDILASFPFKIYTVLVQMSPWLCPFQIPTKCCFFRHTKRKGVITDICQQQQQQQQKQQQRRHLYLRLTAWGSEEERVLNI
jgi:hypothetical protein